MDTPTMPTLPPFIPRKPIKYKPRVVPAPLLQTLTLVSASYDETVPVLTLIFDRAINASAFVASQVIVTDGSINNTVYRGVGPATVEGPTRISVALVRLADAPPAPVTLTATALTGIIAVDDGGTWAGVSELGLPYDG